MPNLIKQIRVRWTGLPTGEGVSTFYCDNDTDVITPQLRTFFAALATSLPGAVTLKFPASGNVIDADTGLVSAVWAVSAPADVSGSGGSTFAAPAGAVVEWNSGIYLDGRQVRGKTYLVPLAPVCFDGGGGVAAATRTAIQNAANTLISSAPGLRLYARLSNGTTSVASASVASTVAILNSRKR